MQSVGPRYPDFLYIGAAKAGSSWIYEILREHPQVFVPDAKDIQFFNYQYDKGSDWYLSFFQAARPDQVAGELDHDYMLRRQCAERIRHLLPDVKLMACLRDPVDRIISQYHYGRSVFLKKGIGIEEFARSDVGGGGSDYYRNLAPYYKIFNREQIKVLFFDELKRDPKRFSRDIYSILGVDNTFAPASLYRPARVARRSRNETLSHFAWKVAKMARRHGLANLVGQIKRNRVFNALLFTPLEKKPGVPDDVRKRIRDMFIGQYKALETLTGRKLPASWYAKK